MSHTPRAVLQAGTCGSPGQQRLGSLDVVVILITTGLTYLRLRVLWPVVLG